MRALLLWLALGCGGPAPEVDEGPVAVRTWLEGEVSGHGGLLVVQTTYDPSGQVDLPRPEVEGLDFAESGDPVLERIGDRDVLTQKFSFTGRKGGYEISRVVATWHGGDEPVVAASSPVFVDIGVEAPREGEPADILEPQPIRQLPWGLIGAAALGFGVLGGGLFVAFGLTRRRALPEAPPEPPDVLALRAWDTIRADPELSPHDKALHLSRIFREYTEAVLSFSATAWTTTEILQHLRGLAHMPEGNLPRAKRLLRATDRVKFAEHDPHGEFFEELDADLRAFVESTRPRQWDEGAR